MTRAEVFGLLQKILVELFQLEPREVSLSTTIDDDLQLDSIDGIDLITTLSDRMGVKIGQDVLFQAHTLSDVVERVLETTGRD